MGSGCWGSETADPSTSLGMTKGRAKLPWGVVAGGAELQILGFDRDDNSVARKRLFTPQMNCHPDRSEAQRRDLQFLYPACGSKAGRANPRRVKSACSCSTFSNRAAWSPIASAPSMFFCRLSMNRVLSGETFNFLTV